jgi:hypothetical protein
LQSQRGEYIVARALRLAIEHIEGMAPEDRPESDKLDMQTMLKAIDRQEYL